VGGGQKGRRDEIKGPTEKKRPSICQHHLHWDRMTVIDSRNHFFQRGRRRKKNEGNTAMGGIGRESTARTQL